MTCSTCQSGALHLRLWASQNLFLYKPQHYIVPFWTQTLGSLRYSFQLWIYLFIIYSIAYNNPSCLVGFCLAKALFVYLPQYWNSIRSKFSILCYPNYRNHHKKSFLEFTKFCKGSCQLFTVVYITVELSSLSYTFLS